MSASWCPRNSSSRSEITLRHLMSSSSGLIDDNDVYAPGAFRAYLARVGDPKLRAQLRAVARTTNPAAQISPLWFIRLAAWQPLLAPPRHRVPSFQHRLDVAGLIAATAAGKPLPLVYRERIFQPLGLRHTAYEPQGPIAGAHARGYDNGGNGTLTDTTASHRGKGADGAIVTDAKDWATFLAALGNGTLLHAESLAELGTGAPSGCDGPAIRTDIGAGNGFASDFVSAVDGSRVAVLLLNEGTPSKTASTRAAAAVSDLYCAG